jgi:cathepsin B
MSQITFSYVPKGGDGEKVFTVPPLNSTELISTPSATGVADQAALTVIPTNKALCNTTPITGAPPSFDFREEFWEYTSPIVDQGSCGACWAIASTQSFASRVAYFNNQRVMPLSAAYLLYCLRESFTETEEVTMGCFGGSLALAFWFFRVYGTVSAECVRYDHLGKWDPSNPDLRTRAITNPATSKKESSVMCPMMSCPSNPTVQPWLYKTALSYIVAGTATQSGASPSNICQEIWEKGPVATGFEVRDDFIQYWKALLQGSLKGKDMVYIPKAVSATNKVQGNHAVQLVGWDSIEGVDYWIAANSWGATDTGNSREALRNYGNNGYFLIVRGVNAVAIESNVVTGIPAVHPNVVNAVGKLPSTIDASMCDLIAYEINLSTLQTLQSPKFGELPDVRNMYEFTLPPIKPIYVGRIRRFPACPPGRDHRCESSGVCVTSPLECGSEPPSQGRVEVSAAIDPILATARDLKLKYVAEQVYKQQQLNIERRRREGLLPLQGETLDPSRFRQLNPIVAEAPTSTQLSTTQVVLFIVVPISVVVVAIVIAVAVNFAKPRSR